MKGYKVVDDKLYFEVYDPYSNLQLNSDLDFWGINRYYLAEELIEAAWAYFPDAIIVENTDTNAITEVR